MRSIEFVDSISQIHRFLGMDAPENSLISLIDLSLVNMDSSLKKIRFCSRLYSIFNKKNCSNSIRYGRGNYDFTEGTMIFASPGKVISFDKTPVPGETEGWVLFFHPDLIRGTSVEKNLSDYSFFEYETLEALHLSMQENDTISEIVDRIKEEYKRNTDIYSRDLIVSGLELFLNYCRRFYGRQFITRKAVYSDRFDIFKQTLKDYYEETNSSEIKLPTVLEIAAKMNLSANYLSDLLKQETGNTAQEHIHFFIIEKAKSFLIGSEYSIKEISYMLGFEHPPSFSKMFKEKTGTSPKQFRTIYF